MIKRLNITDYGSYKNFRWPEGDDTYIFKKINIIYGHNYSGKTTLSRIFNTLETKTPHIDYTSGNYEVFVDDGSSIKSSDLQIFTPNYQVRVYNSDFIKSNLSWLYNNDGSIQPFTVLGERNVALQEEIQSLKDILGSEESETGCYFELKNLHKKKYDLSQNFSKLNDDVNRRLSDIASIIRGNQQIYNRNPYNRTHLESDMDIIHGYHEFSDEERVKCLTQLEERELKNLPYKKLEYINIISIIEKSVDLLKQTVTISNPIQELLNNELLRSWVDEGVNLHKQDYNKCKFCGSPISSETWLKLTSHFNIENDALQDKIDTCIIECSDIIEKIQNHFIYETDDFYIVFQNEYFTTYEDWTKKKSVVIDELRRLITSLYYKKKNTAEIVNCEFNYVLVYLLQESDKLIHSLIEKNSLKSSTLKSDKLGVGKKLLMSDILRFLRENEIECKKSELGSLRSSVINAEREYNEKLHQISDIESIIQHKKNLEKDESKGAERINEYLSKYFGSNEIQLYPKTDNGITSYSINRNGVLAKNLSDGECSLISFCYFIAKIEDLLNDSVNSEDYTDANSNETKPIIYIDDPVSSLDNNHVFFIFSIIDEKVARSQCLHQLFISTHNLDFLKYIRRITGEDSNKAYFTIFKERKQNDVRSTISPMQLHLKNYVTEFNFLFNQMYIMYKEVSGERSKKITNTYNNFYSLPNNIRKFLELYLFYRYPNNAPFSDKLNMMFEDNVPILINRIVNEYSHLSYIERAWKPFDVPELEECVKVIFDKMREYDRMQFEIMVDECK